MKTFGKNKRQPLLPVLAQEIMLEGMRMERKKERKKSTFSDRKRVWFSLKCTFSRRLLLSVCLSVCVREARWI